MCVFAHTYLSNKDNSHSVHTFFTCAELFPGNDLDLNNLWSLSRKDEAYGLLSHCVCVYGYAHTLDQAQSIGGLSSFLEIKTWKSFLFYSYSRPQDPHCHKHVVLIFYFFYQCSYPAQMLLRSQPSQSQIIQC